MNGNGFSGTDLAALQRQVAAWRRARRGRCRLPDELWAAAASLGNSEGVSWVARALRLDYYRLKRRCAQGAIGTVKRAGSPTFVEVQLDPSFAEHRGRWRIELRDESAARLTIEMGTDLPALVAVVDAFWKRRS